jgi:hypothetical protein
VVHRLDPIDEDMFDANRVGVQARGPGRKVIPHVYRAWPDGDGIEYDDIRLTSRGKPASPA